MELQDRLKQLSELCKLQDDESSQKGFRWSENVRREVVELVKNGISEDDLFRWTRISKKTISRWIEVESPQKFKEAKLVEKKSKIEIVENLITVHVSNGTLDFEISGLTFDQAIVLTREVL